MEDPAGGKVLSASLVFACFPKYSVFNIETAVSAQLLVYNNTMIQVIAILELLVQMLGIAQRLPAVIITVCIVQFAFLLCKGTTVSVKLAGWDSTVSRKRMSASPVHAKMVAPVKTDTMASPVGANLVLEVINIIAFHRRILKQYYLAVNRRNQIDFNNHLSH